MCVDLANHFFDPTLLDRMQSLPFLVRLVAATILAKQNHVLIAEVTYLRAEIAYFRDQLPKDKSLRFTDRWRKRLARAVIGVGWKRLAEIATVAKADTIRQWHRLMLKGKLDIQKAGPGKPPTSDECIRRCWFIGPGGLERALNRYLVHYHEQRPHQGKGNRPLSDSAQTQLPARMPHAAFKADKVSCVLSNNGTLRHYELAA